MYIITAIFWLPNHIKFELHGPHHPAVISLFIYYLKFPPWLVSPLCNPFFRFFWFKRGSSRVLLKVPILQPLLLCYPITPYYATSRESPLLAEHDADRQSVQKGKDMVYVQLLDIRTSNCYCYLLTKYYELLVFYFNLGRQNKCIVLCFSSFTYISM